MPTRSRRARCSSLLLALALVIGLLVTVASPSSGADVLAPTGTDRCVPGDPVTGIQGTVRSSGPAARPVRGAWVAVLRPDDFSLAGGTEADQDGSFLVEVEPGDYYVYLVDPKGHHTPGFAGRPNVVTVGGGLTDLAATMASLRGSISGTVTEAGSGRPIPGAWAVALSGTTGMAERAVVADEEGRYTLEGMAAGTHFLGLVDPGGAHQSRFVPDSPNVPDSTPVGVTPGVDTTADAALPGQEVDGGGSSLTGTVTDATSGAPLNDVFVVAMHAADFRLARTGVTDADGAYTLDVSAGEYKMVFLPSSGLHDIEWYDDQPYYGIERAGNATAPGRADADLAPRAASIDGTVVDDASGDPVGCAWVIAIGPSGIAGGVLTDADGRYSIDGLAPGTYRMEFVDVQGGRTLEFWEDSADIGAATPIDLRAGDAVTADAALHLPAPPAPTPPANDDFAAGQVVSGASGQAGGTNVAATQETGEPDHAGDPGGASVWYRWTAPSAGTVTFDTCSTTLDTTLAAYTGTTVGALTGLTANDNSCGTGRGSAISFAATAGTTYRVAVDGLAAVTGPFTLRWAADAGQAPTHSATWTGPSAPGRFNGAAGAALDASGNVYIADSGNHRIQKFAADGTFVAQWGGFGNAPGRFSTPMGVAVNANGVYVADTQNHRVQQFAHDGTFIRQWGTAGSGAGQMTAPQGVAVTTSGRVYVADTGNHRIQRYTATGSLSHTFGAFGNGTFGNEFNTPTELAVDASGNVYVGDTGNSRIQRYTSAYEYDLSYGTQGYVSHADVTGLAVRSDGNLLVAGRDPFGGGANQVVSVRDPFSGYPIGYLASFGYDAGQVASPQGVATGAGGVAYTLESGNVHRVQQFAGDDTFVRQWGSFGVSVLYQPRGIAVAPVSGQVLVADTSTHQINRFDAAGGDLPAWACVQVADVAVAPSGAAYCLTVDQVLRLDGNGAVVGQWGTAGSGAGQFSSPQAVSVDASGFVYVADTGNHRIQKFSATGTFVAQWGSSGSGPSQFSSPQGVAVDTSGAVYVADTGNGRVQKFSATGAFLAQWGTSGSGNGQFSSPQGIAVGPADSVYVTDTGNHRIQHFTRTGRFLATWGAVGGANGEFTSPEDVTVTDAGVVLVADTGNRRIQRFTEG